MSKASNFIWYELMTSDPAGAARFYGAVVGWTIAATRDPAAGDVDYRMIVRGDGGNAGGVLALGADMLAGGARPGWMGYLEVDDVDSTLAAIKADGGAVHMPATDLPVGRIAMVSDPQGAHFYVMDPIPPEGMETQESDVFSVTEAQHMRWNELATSDSDAAIAFYRKHFGWGQEGAMDMGPLGSYRFLQRGEVMIGAVMPLMEGYPVPVWNFYIGVDDIDRAHAAVTANGGTVTSEPMEIPGGEYAMNGIDPQGAAFGLVGPRR
ncbi:VOC family protein [Sphingopyxis sp. SE2]|jgi:predicted enzyme related to lactoylglutathione lyase|uniref:VOC family protein n=1 Tax=unclassified Sphingopyxis TaxID=2614943 RepID=UPI00051041E6|nr:MULTISPECIES: VOC family protein [unclassified Sphingopyxis]KGB57992.1 Glyoxalase/bleomycin resistance protein/dioxygenase [Sphingopyxis sp. LC363]MDT7529599.1 VOC family protein [Sphingopyxis sp. SE2]